jgi:hypothetical protein
MFGDDFLEIQVGEKVIMHRGGYHSDSVGTVERITAKQFVLAGVSTKFWKENGDAVGRSNMWHGKWCTKASEETIKKVEDQCRLEAKAAKADRLFHSANLKSMGEDSLDAILAILEKEKN